MQALTASWGAWMGALERCQELPAARRHVQCPDCGAAGLRLTFCGPEEDRSGTPLSGATRA